MAEISIRSVAEFYGKDRLMTDISLDIHNQAGIPARLDFVEELGSGCLTHFLHDDIGLTVLSEDRHDFDAGEPVRIAVPPTALNLFDATSTRALASVDSPPVDRSAAIAVN